MKTVDVGNYSTRVRFSEVQFGTDPRSVEKWIPKEGTYVPAGANPEYRIEQLRAHYAFLPDETISRIMQGYLARGMSPELAILAIPSAGDVRWDWVLTPSGPACTVREENLGLTLTFEGERLARWERAKTP